jgi:hypothetical protein
MSGKQIFTWVLIIFLLPTLACGLFGGGGDEAALEADISAPTSQASTDEEAVVEDVETVKEEAESAEPETVEFVGVTGLNELSAYRVNFVMAFDGQSGDQPSVGKIEMLLEVTKDPPARHLKMSMEGTTVEEEGGTNAIDFYKLGDMVYMKNAAMGDTWISFSGEDAGAFEQGFFAPDEQLDLPKTAHCDSQVETINGISAAHCSFTEEDIVGDEATYDTLRGEVWVATEGNYIVKFNLEADGYRSLQEGEGLFDFGSVSYEYELKDPNGDFTITPPEEAQGATNPLEGITGGGSLGDFPTLDDAQQVTSAPGLLNYYTASDIPTVVDFYRQELPANGWQENVDQGYVGDDNASLNFQKDGDILTVVLVKEDSQTNVILTTVGQ